uniref:Uncharacterized protein n=1 Tax=Arion vulgaris TaxID=1028688 RepID=A0A0B7AM52_9EUPU
MGNRDKGRPKNTWRLKLEMECKKLGRECRDLEKMIFERRAWKSLVSVLCFPRGEG